MCEKARGRWIRGIGLGPFYKGGEYQESLGCLLEVYLTEHGVIPMGVVGLPAPVLMGIP